MNDEITVQNNSRRKSRFSNIQNQMKNDIQSAFFIQLKQLLEKHKTFVLEDSKAKIKAFQERSIEKLIYGLNVKQVKKGKLISKVLYLSDNKIDTLHLISKGSKSIRKITFDQISSIDFNEQPFLINENIKSLTLGFANFCTIIIGKEDFNLIFSNKDDLFYFLPGLVLLI